MSRTKALLIASLTISAAIILPLREGLRAQCYGSLALMPDFFEFDHLVRLAVHFGTPEDIPEDIICSRSLMPGETEIEVPIYAYNLHAGLTRLEFSIESNDSIADFVPASGFMLIYPSRDKENGLYYFNVKVQGPPVCGPVLVGHALIERVTFADPVWIDLVPNRITARMYAYDNLELGHYAFPPHHGGYVGNPWLYNCQEPICPEPNLPVTDLEAIVGYGCAVELTWTAGAGNVTVIRARTDCYPMGYGDGRLVLEIASSPGQQQYYTDTEIISGTTYFYKAFSLTMDAQGNVINNSFVECEAVVKIKVDCEISVEKTSWGRIKSLYR